MSRKWRIKIDHWENPHETMLKKPETKQNKAANGFDYTVRRRCNEITNTFFSPFNRL